MVVILPCTYGLCKEDVTSLGYATLNGRIGERIGGEV